MMKLELILRSAGAKIVKLVGLESETGLAGSIGLETGSRWAESGNWEPRLENLVHDREIDSKHWDWG